LKVNAYPRLGKLSNVSIPDRDSLALKAIL